ncbi:hypothetical protein HYG81_21830 (plasmid) [Natrinema zhouii]|uniref:hypothetical protein n=1 Tax=Natrinema zhouii TaxID=1710539 RepID=UPI001CFFEF48|nr:hypothetical protein [Natrinema zhouii]UHQ98620.1 hypothetical protein HYG81_21830 [Natrinema zhouii]
MPSRRRVLVSLATGLCAAFAGCSMEPTGVLRLSDATTDEILEPATFDVRSNDGGNDDGIDEMRELVAEVLETGSATASGEHPPLQVAYPVRFEDEVVALDRTELTTETRNNYHLLLDFDVATEGVERSVDTLPPADVEWIESALSDRRSSVDAVSGERTYTEDEQATSVLIPEPAFDVLLVDGERMGVEVEPVKTTVTTYEYTLAERLGSDEQYAQTLESRYRFAVTGLSDDERDVVDEAVAERGYYASSTDDGAFEGVAHTLFEHEPVASTDSEGHWIVAYEGTTYVAMLDPVRYESLRRDLPTSS